MDMKSLEIEKEGGINIYNMENRFKTWNGMNG